MKGNQIGIKIVLTLIAGVFILGGILLNIALGEDVVHNLDIDGNGGIDIIVTLTTDTDIDEGEHPDADPEDLATFSVPAPTWNLADDFSHGAGSISVSGTRIDDEGNEIGSVSVIGGVEVTVDFKNLTVTSYYWAYASSNVSGDNEDWDNGDTWVQVPGNAKRAFAYFSSDTTTYVETIPEFRNNLSSKTMEAYAMLSTEGARIEVKFKAEGQEQ